MLSQRSPGFHFVPGEEAIVHHYRNIDPDMNDFKEYKNCSILDKRILAFTKNMIQSNIYEMFMKKSFLDNSEKVIFCFALLCFCLYMHILFMYMKNTISYAVVIDLTFYILNYLYNIS